MPQHEEHGEWSTHGKQIEARPADAVSCGIFLEILAHERVDVIRPLYGLHAHMSDQRHHASFISFRTYVVACNLRPWNDRIDQGS